MPLLQAPSKGQDLPTVEEREGKDRLLDESRSAQEEEGPVVIDQTFYTGM